ncbi:MAG: hypothetical protein GF317_01915 [Candidatus Lokiarchaeota archaeon]|nr:hypothetical protein [Candidatus Lokiarchaeota archaeon]MBD3198697.1 hypothetical protein [Candidatus Lokiarchaeota archaeon]
MKRNYTKALLLSLPLIFLTLFILSPISRAASLSIDPISGKAPIVDGLIDVSADEWEESMFYNLSLKSNENDPGLRIDLKVMQIEKNLYFLVQYELESSYVGNNEIIGLLISESSSELIEDFKDAKIVNISNLNNYTYSDYDINSNFFINDMYLDGEGAATKESIDSDIIRFTFEFKLPINESLVDVNDEDVILEYGSSYAFNISHGNTPIYPQGFIRSNIITLNLLEHEQITQPLDFELITLVTSIIIFGIVGVFYVFYLYRIILLKNKLERIRL